MNGSRDLSDEFRREYHLVRLREVYPDLPDDELVDRAVALFRELVDFTIAEPEGSIVMLHGWRLPYVLPRALAWARRPLEAVAGVRSRDRVRIYVGS